MSILGYLGASLRAAWAPAPKAKGKASPPPRKPGPAKAAPPVMDAEEQEIARRQAKPFVMPPPSRMLSASVSLCIDAGGLHLANKHYQRRVRQEWAPELVEWLSALSPDEVRQLGVDIRRAEKLAARFLARDRVWQEGEDRQTLQVGVRRLDRLRDLDAIHDLAARVSGAGVEMFEALWLQRAKDQAEKAASVDGAPPPAPEQPKPKASSTDALMGVLAGLSAPPEPEPEPFPVDLDDEEPPPWPGAHV